MASASSPSKTESSTCYIPPIMDPLSASRRAMKENPMRLFLRDTLTLIKLLYLLPNVFLPLSPTKDENAEYYRDVKHTKERLLQLLLCVLELLLLLVFVPALILLPGGVFLLVMALSIFLVRLLARPMGGPAIAFSEVDRTTQQNSLQHAHERWIFINGCASGHSTIQGDINSLSHIFGRSIVGIHNRSYGLVADILECLIQRVFDYKTTDVRVAYEQIKTVLCHPTVQKVILIGHSQGGIVISLVLDQLFAELPHPLMQKLEIYTFGSAAGHFSNPYLSVKPLPKKRLRPLEREHVIPCIEHYANEYDMVPRWGVLNSTKSILSNRYAGSVFVRMRASGHMFVQHYIHAIFPDELGSDQQPAKPWLDRIVDVDEETVERREAAIMGDLRVVRQESGLQFGNGERLEDGGASGAEVLSFDRTGSGRLIVEEARGKSVRELSRLWKYQGGRSPDEGVRS